MKLRRAPSARRDRACLRADPIREAGVRHLMFPGRPEGVPSCAPDTSGWPEHAGYRCGMTGPDATEARRLDLSDPGTLRRLRDLQRASYAVEAELIGFDGIPALHESLEELRDCGESFLGLDDETGLAGAVSWVRLQDGTLDICRLMVHPRAHRRGIATALLDAWTAPNRRGGPWYQREPPT